MAVFAVYIQDDQDMSVVHGRLEEHYPDSLRLADNLYLVQGDTIAQAIAETLRIKGPERDSTGAVFKLNGSYSGYASRAIWEWLGQAEQS